MGEKLNGDRMERETVVRLNRVNWEGDWIGLKSCRTGCGGPDDGDHFVVD